jgi:Xaa-Pro aminopeptidase
MEKEGLDVLIASFPENIYYLSEYESIGHRILYKTQIFAMFELGKDQTTLVVPLAEVPTALERFPEFNMTCFGHFYFAYNEEDLEFGEVKRIIQASESDSIQALCKNLERLDKTSRRIGLDESRLTPTQWKHLEITFPDKKFMPAFDIFGEIRTIKHESEVALLERAAEIAEESLFNILPKIKKGSNENEIGRWYMQEVVERGAEPYFNVVTIDERSAFADTINTKKMVKDGSIIRFDIGCVYQGYRSDIARTAVFGKCTEKVKKYYRAILIGEERAIKQIKPGVSAEHIFNVAVEEIRKAGISHYERHHCGHGIGLDVYDPPSVALGIKTQMRPGMVLCIETPYYELGWGGIQVEDTIVVTDTGSRYLTKSSRELIRVGV